MSISNSGLGRQQSELLRGRRTSLEPLVIKPREAWRMLACGNTRGYQLLATGELDSFLDGRSRKITVSSIHAYIARKLAATRATAPAQRDAV